MKMTGMNFALTLSEANLAVVVRQSSPKSEDRNIVVSDGPINHDAVRGYLESIVCLGLRPAAGLLH